MAVHFEDNSMQVRAALDAACIAFLHEAGGELEAQTKRNNRVDTGQTQNSWRYVVDESKGECTVGSPLENAIWEEFGTGEYALKNNGRKGGWFIPEEKLSPNAKSKMKKVKIKGKVFYFTKGKKPNRPLQKAFDSCKNALIRRAQQILNERLGN